MFYTIYKTTNNINGKYYIGKHKTRDLDDNYLGSGKILNYAIKKHGINNFTREYLFIFDNEEDMNNKELELVSEEFIKEDTNYNLKLGGEGGWDYINNSEEFNICKSIAGKASQAVYKKGGYSMKRSEYTRELLSKQATEQFKINGPNYGFSNKKHTEEFKEHIGKINSIKQKGSNNSQYGMMWIYSLEEKISKRIKKDEIIPEGWYKGRKMQFN